MCVFFHVEVTTRRIQEKPGVRQKVTYIYMCVYEEKTPNQNVRGSLLGHGGGGDGGGCGATISTSNATLLLLFQCRGGKPTKG